MATTCRTCGGDGVLIEESFANGRDIEIEVACPDCSTDDYDDRELREELQREHDEVYAERYAIETRERLTMVFGSSFIEELS